MLVFRSNISLRKSWAQVSESSHTLLSETTGGEVSLSCLFAGLSLSSKLVSPNARFLPSEVRSDEVECQIGAVMRKKLLKASYIKI